VRADDLTPVQGWTRTPVRLDDLAIAYMGRAAAAAESVPGARR
jgi:hypothetical protein